MGKRISWTHAAVAAAVLAGGGAAPVTFELRRAGKPVNPLQFLG